METEEFRSSDCATCHELVEHCEYFQRLFRDAQMAADKFQLEANDLKHVLEEAHLEADKYHRESEELRHSLAELQVHSHDMYDMSEEFEQCIFEESGESGHIIEVHSEVPKIIKCIPRVALKTLGLMCILSTGDSPTATECARILEEIHEKFKTGLNNFSGNVVGTSMLALTKQFHFPLLSSFFDVSVASKSESGCMIPVALTEFCEILGMNFANDLIPTKQPISEHPKVGSVRNFLKPYPSDQQLREAGLGCLCGGRVPKCGSADVSPRVKACRDHPLFSISGEQSLIRCIQLALH